MTDTGQPESPPAPAADQRDFDALHAENLRFTYPPRGRQKAFEALKGMTVRIPQGQTVALLGPNGSGKSTFMKIVCGMLLPQEGSVHSFGSSRIQDIRRSLGVVFQSEGLDPHLTVYENLRDQASLYGIHGSERTNIINDELAKANLTDRRGSLVKTLSKGLARRVDLCRALLNKPRLLMLDEPTVGLDPSARQAFLETLDRCRNEDNLTILMSTHLIDEADRMDRVIFMHKGEIMADDPPTVLRNRLGKRRVSVLDPSWTPPANEKNKWSPAPGGGGWWKPLDDDGEQSSHLIHDLVQAGVSCTIAPPTLADAFEQLTGTKLNHDEVSSASEAQS